MHKGFSYLGLQPELSMIEKEINKYINFTADERKQLQHKMLVNDLRNGRENVLELINTVTEKIM